MNRRNRIVFASSVGVIGVVAALVLTGSIHHTVTLTASDIQQGLQSKFPVEKKTLIFTAKFTDPTTSIDSATSKVTLGLTATLSALGLRAGTAKGEATGDVRYESKTGEFFLDQPKVIISDLMLTGLAERNRSTASALLESGLKEYFSRAPIYRLDDKDSKFLSVRRVLKSLRVADGKIEIELGL